MTDKTEDKMREAASIDNLGRNLTKIAEEGQLRLVYERKDEIKNLASLLVTGEFNVILVGQSGVGKNAIVEGLARWIHKAKSSSVPDELKNILNDDLVNKKIIETNASDFIIGCHYAHNLENKIRYIVEECNNNDAILFIDNINMIINSGNSSNDLDGTVANILIPYISSKQIKVIGATTHEGYDFILENNQQLLKHFIKMQIPETTSKDTKTILSKLKKRYENSYNVEIEDGCTDIIVELADRFFPSSSFPGKAFNLQKEVISDILLKDNNLKKDDIYRIIQNRTGFPDFIIHRNKTVEYDEIREFFTDRLYGQDHTIDAVVNTILYYKAELNNPNKPINSFLFAGPTGVGKTELAKLIAEYLFGSEDKLHRYDMPNYADENGLNLLIGGSDWPRRQGLLFSNALANPWCITLFDEIEKANHSIFNALLSILDEGKLTDKNGRTAFFNNSIIIMTSNLGADLYQKKTIALGPNTAAEVTDNVMKKSIEMFFNPEFINRINKTLYFKPLSREDIKKVIKKELNNMLNRSGIRWRNLKIQADEDVYNHLIDTGYSSVYGARAIQRAIQEHLLYPLAGILSSENISNNTIIKLTVKDNKVIPEKK